MQVDSVAAIPLSYPLEDGRAFGHARGVMDTRSAMLVRVETTTGEVGYGEALAPPQTTATAVEEVLAPMVEGASPYEVETLTERTHQEAYNLGGGPILQSAVSAVDIALWDLIGKATGEPIYRLLGGQQTEAVTPYASTMYITEWGEDPAEPIERAVEEGFTAAKLKIGRSVEDDVERVATARELLGDDAHLMVDYNGNYRLKQAIQSANALEPYDLTWIEEPVPPEDYTGLRKLTDRVDVPVATGESHFGRFDYKRLIADHGVDIIQPDLGRAGGFSESRFLAKWATTENVAVYPHVWNGAVGVAAALQFAASLPSYPHNENVPEPLLFEFDRSQNPLRDELLDAPLDPTGGSLAVPQGPGLGVSVNEDAVERFRTE
ncbi:MULTISPECIES: mandelate racemase/muconate lactonizing enzyme family protein [unclassified Haladaptatus]|uniref:mandelate racemase/muconate lactonizing enzyme family protein n=1 Tax=unclassified Haladaptatus TaxID=2622732 RepID=UPI0023E88209|nr:MULTISPECIES: mandelate racemase/muconate lactonizing enzyme family protein [unclassified Haladaptatus]